MDELEFERVPPSAGAAAELIRELDREPAERYPLDSIHGLHPEELISFPGVFLVCRTRCCVR